MPRPDFIFYLSTFLPSSFSFLISHLTLIHSLRIMNGKGKLSTPSPPAGYSPCLRGRVSYNRKYRASQLSL